jgi:hypothetical protein
MPKERIISCARRSPASVFLHERLGHYIQRLVAATAPVQSRYRLASTRSSELVERGVDLGGSPRAIICWGRLAKVWALLVRIAPRSIPEDIQDLAPVRAGTPYLAGPARRQPRPHHRRGDRDIIERVPVHETQPPGERRQRCAAHLTSPKSPRSSSSS